MQRWERNERSRPTDRSMEGPGHSLAARAPGRQLGRVPEPEARIACRRRPSTAKAGGRSIANCQPDSGPMGAP